METRKHDQEDKGIIFLRNGWPKGDENIFKESCSKLINKLSLEIGLAYIVLPVSLWIGIKFLNFYRH